MVVPFHPNSQSGVLFSFLKTLSGVSTVKEIPGTIGSSMLLTTSIVLSCYDIPTARFFPPALFSLLLVPDVFLGSHLLPGV